MRKVVSFLTAVLCLFVFMTGVAGIALASNTIKVSVSVLPQAYFVERIGGDMVDVRVMIPKGASPATYAPTPQQLVMLSDSRIYVKVGSPTFSFEKKYFNSIIERNKKMIVVNMSNGIKYRSFAFKKSAKDPHVWVAPYTVKIAARNIYNALSKIDPSNRNYYKTNLNSFLQDIKKLDNEIKTVLVDKRDYSFMVFHPAWGYFADEYGLKQLPIEVKGKTPSPSNIQKMIDTAKEKGIRVIFVQKGFDTRSAKVIADEIGGKVMEIDPLEKDWLLNTKNIAKTLRDVLKK